MGRTLSLSDFWFLAFAVRWTVLLSLIAFAGGAAGGILITVLRFSRYRLLGTYIRA